MSRRVLLEDLKSVGSDWMFERGTNVEIRRRFSEETREALSEEQHIEADVDRDCFPHIRESRLERQNRAGSKWVTAHGSASRIMAEQREVHCTKRSRINSSV
jgi:hypothetical protein